VLFKDQLVKAYKNSKDQDLSDILRGRILTLEEILDLETAMKSFDNLTPLVQQDVVESQKKEATAPAL